MKVLLVQPPAHSNIGVQTFILPEPLGLEAIAASLINDHEVHILDMRLEHDLSGKLASIKPDVVGVSISFTPDAYNAYKVLDIVRDYDPSIRTIVGGHHATMCHTDFAGRADAVVLGEGELTMPELLRFWEEDKPLQEVEGIAFQSHGGWKQTKLRPLIKNLDETPLPARHLVAKYRNHYFHGTRRPHALVETSRGCPYRCNFCSVWRFHQGLYRARSPERVAYELSQVEARYVLFTDDNFLADASRAEKIFRAIKEKAINKYYIMQVRADSVIKHKDILVKWVSAGLEAVFVGFESVTQKGLDELRKRLSVAQIEEAAKTLGELGITAMTSFIVDTNFKKEDFVNLKRFVNRMKLRTPFFAILTPLPGTILYEERARELTTNNYELFDLHHAVLPTSLSLRRFYTEYLRLYLSSYLSHVTPRAFGRALRTGSLLSYLRRLFRDIWHGIKLVRNANPWSLVKHHHQLPGKLSKWAKAGPGKKANRVC